MTRIRVVTDSASDLPEEFAQRLDIDVVSLTIRFGDEEFVDRVDLTPDAFWAKCKGSKTLPERPRPRPAPSRTPTSERRTTAATGCSS